MLQVLFLSIVNYFYSINILFLLIGFSIYFLVGGIRFGIKLGGNFDSVFYYGEDGFIRNHSLFRKIFNSLKRFFEDIFLNLFSFSNMIMIILFLILSFTYTKELSIQMLYIFLMFYLTSLLHTFGFSFSWIFKK
ncbi:MAG: hypothetical protein ACRCZO_10260 [Cetobacterium sp.]